MGYCHFLGAYALKCPNPPPRNSHNPFWFFSTINKVLGSLRKTLRILSNVRKKINLAFLLKDLFVKDKLFKVYAGELSDILRSIDFNDIPDDYIEVVEQNLDKNLSTKIKFDNEILHRSKVIRHFLDNNEKKSRTESF